MFWDEVAGWRDGGKGQKKNEKNIFGLTKQPPYRAIKGLFRTSAIVPEGQEVFKPISLYFTFTLVYWY